MFSLYLTVYLTSFIFLKYYFLFCFRCFSVLLVSWVSFCDPVGVVFLLDGYSFLTVLICLVLGLSLRFPCLLILVILHLKK